jgi:GDPmannose 4,6-dehydratase
LLAHGYRVVGGYRRTSGINAGRLEELGIADDVELVDLELLEESNIRRQIETLKPDEIYNLAAQSFVGLSFEQPLYTSNVDALGVLRLLEAIREACPGARLYQASTSEMSARRKRRRRTRRRPSIRAAPMAWPSCSAIGAW